MNENDIASSLVPDSAGRVLVEKRIYFGHQSVGYNLVDGLNAWIKARPELGLRVVETRSPSDMNRGTFAHAANGKNHEPLKKIEDFARTIEGGVGENVDIAFFKFCYVDITPETDVEGLFGQYETTLARLSKAYPSTKFVHVTVPLTVVESGMKATVKRMLGRKLGGADANVARNRFNELMRTKYAGSEPLFDLAKVEATRIDGSSVSFNQAGSSYPALANEYASDGKHLNAAGARWVAGHLLKTLVGLEN